MRAKVKKVELVADRNLLINEEIIGDDDLVYKDFNNVYKQFCDLNEKEDLSKEELNLKIELLKKVVYLVAFDFDLEKEIIKDKANEYVFFTRDALYWLANKPYHDAESIMILIKSLYGQTNVGYAHTDETKESLIKDGNAWVEYLERNTKDKVLKSYAATLRAFQYIVNGELLELTIPERLHKTERELKYAICWNQDNYLAYYAMGLLYSDSANDKYNKDLAIENFKKVGEYDNKENDLDKYLVHGEKQKAMDNASKKVILLEF